MSDVSKSPFLRACAIAGVLLSTQARQALAGAGSCQTGLELRQNHFKYFIFPTFGTSFGNSGNLEVGSVAPGSIADRAGIVKGQQVNSINDSDVRTMDVSSLGQAVQEAKALNSGQSLKIELAGSGIVNLPCPAGTTP